MTPDGNIYDQFDEDVSPARVDPVPSAPPANVYDQFDEEPDVKPAEVPANPPRTPLPAMPGAVFTDDDPELNEAVTKLDAQVRRDGTDAINEARGKSFLTGILAAEAELLRPLLPGQQLSQHHAELVKGIPSGTVASAGTALQGAAAVKASGELNASRFGRGQLDVFDRIDRGEAVPEMDDPVGYQHLSPEQRQAVRADVERAAASFTPTPLAEQGLYRAGESVKAFAKTILPAAPGYEQAFSRQIGEGTGSMLLGLPVALVGGGATAGLLYGAMGSGEAAERAIEYDRKEKAAGREGLSQDDINKAALWGVAPGATDVLPVEMLLGRLKVPQPFAHWIGKGIARIGGETFWRVGRQAAVEGGQEGFQTFLQNLIASEYRADQRLTEDILPSSGIGAGVGGLAQSAQEIARLWISAAAGRRARNAPFPGDAIAAEDRAREAAGAEAPPPASAAPEAAPPASEDAGQRGVDVLQFVRSKGGLQPSGELDAADAKRYPGLVSGKGLDADKMREAMVEAGYLEEAGPDAPAVTTPQDVFDLVGRAIGGERIVPIADREADAAFTASQTARDEAREFLASEQQFTIPEISRLDAEIGEPVLRQAYDRLDETARREVIDRNRRGEDVGDLIEEMAIRAEDAPTIAAMAMKRGLRPEQVAQLREVVARERPELLPDVDELVEAMPKRVSAAPGASRRAHDIADAIRETAEAILPPQVRVQVVDTLGRPGDDGLFAIRAYHGTGADFPRFRSDMIGTGEGEQVFGHGIYLAENENVGKYYQEKLGGEDVYVDGKPLVVGKKTVGTTGDRAVDSAIIAYGSIEGGIGAANRMKRMLEQFGRATPEKLAEIDDEIARLTAFQGSVERRPAGFLYEVDIDVEPHQLLDYDAKLADQPEMLAKVTQLLRDAGSDVTPDALRTQPGSWAYSELEAMLGSADAASRALKEAGIPGLRYFDAGSRGGPGEASRNIVIFDDGLIKITKKNGEAVSGEERQAAVDAMFGLRGFYSPAIRAAQSISMKKGTGEQFFKQITKTPGVRKDELEWMGLEEFLKDKPSVTRDEVLAFMRAHQVELDEKQLTNAITAEKALAATTAEEVLPKIQWSEDWFEQADKVWSYRIGEEQYYITHGEEGWGIHSADGQVMEGDAANLAQAQHMLDGHHTSFHDDPGMAKFGDYKVPGGENYRELLIRLPELGEQRALTGHEQDRLTQVDKRLAELRKLDEDDVSFGDAPPPSREFEKSSLLKERAELTKPGAKYTSKHFQDQEIVHLRVDDRTGPGGEKVLFINEVQSDLHQAGRKEGYSSSKDLADRQKERDALKVEIDDLNASLARANQDLVDAQRQEEGASMFTRGKHERKVREVVARRSEIITQIEQAKTRLNAIGGDLSKKEVPNAPFKGDLWLELALKRALLYASENGYDAVSWARSDQIAKAVGAEPEKLALQYDSKIGKFLRDYTKKWGAKVESTSLDGASRLYKQSELFLADHGGDVDGALHAMDDIPEGWDAGTRDIVRTDLQRMKEDSNGLLRITPEMRASVMEGQPLGLRKGEGSSGPIAEGRFDPNELLITIAADALDPAKTLRHEGIHALRTMGLFTAKQWSTLEAAARKQGWIESTNVRELYQDLYGKGRSDADLQPLLIEEAIAEQFSLWRNGEKTFKGPIAKLFQQIQQFLDRLGNALRGRGFQTADDVFEAVRSGELASRAPMDVGARPAALQATAGILADSPARQASAGIDRPSESLANLIASFNKALGLTVRQGRIDPGLALSAARTGGKVRGQASRVTGVVRLRVMQEFDTLAHEGGHSLENRFKRPLEAIKLRHAAELTPLASPGPDALSEGFAEWFRRYVTNPVASKRTAPGFEQDFERFLGAQDPAMLASLREIRDGYQEWLKAPSGGVVAGSLATTVKPGSSQAVMREIEDRGLRNTIQGWVDKLYTSVFDDLHPINLAVQDLLKIAQANLPAGKEIGLKTANDAYKLLRLGRDAYAGGHMDLLYGVAPYRSTQAQGPSFRDALGKAFGGLSRGRWNEKISTDFGAYLVSRRMVQEWHRFTAGEISNPPDKFSLADHQQSVADFEKAYPQFRNAAADVHAFLGNMLKKKRDAGLITAELYDTLSKRIDYVPVLRDMSDRGGEVEGRAPSRKDKQSVIKTFRGSQRDVINPLESIAKDAYETSAIISRNEAVKALDALARAAGPDGGRFAERIPAHEMQSSRVNIQDAIKKAADDAGIAAADLQVMIQAVDDKLGDNAIAEVWKSGELNERGEPIVYLWESGKRIPIRLADGQFGHDMLHAITGLNKEASGWIVNLLSLPSTAVRMGVTTSLDFIGANYIRDQVSAWVLTRGFVPFWDGAKGIYSDLTMREVSRIYSRAGGIFGGANVTSLSEARIKREVLELRRRGIRITLNPFTRDFWRMTEFSETGTRIAVFQKAFDRAKADGLSEYEAALEAAFAARDYIDFGRRGSRMLAARRLIPFFNAALQGLDRTVRGLRGKIDDHRILRDAISPYIKSRTGQPLSVVERRNLGRAARVWGYMAVLGMLGLAQSLLYRDDEEYEEISDYIRNTHWLFKIDGEWVRIPKPFELATFSNMVERTFEYVHKDDPSAVERFTDGLFQVLTPPHSMPGVDVAVQLATNKREITVAEAVASLIPGRKLPADQPIVGRDLEGLPPELRFNAYASEFGKYLGGAVGSSPAVIDHMVTGFGASWGREFLNATNQALPALGRATGGAFRLPTNQAAETAISDYFLLRRFMKDATRGAVSNKEFWELIGEGNGSFIQAANGYKLLVDKIRDAKGAQEFLDSLPENERAYALLEAGNSGSRSKLQLLHPLNRAKEITSVASGLRKEINLHRLYRGKGEDAQPVELSPAQMRVANDVLSDISMREARNALIALNVDGWRQKAVMPVEALWAELAAAAPEVHEIALERLKSKKLPSFEDVRAQWPEARKRLLEEGQDALLHDLYAREVPSFGRREYQPEIRP